MFSVRKIATGILTNRSTYAISLPFGKKRVPTPNDLQKYDVVVIGANLGNVVASHLDKVVGEKAKIYVSYDQLGTQFTGQRDLFEQACFPKYKYLTATRQLISKNNAHSDGVGVQKINPQENSVTLRNGKTIKYDNLVVAMGQKENYKSIEGFDDAWEDLNYPFYTNKEHANWKLSSIKSWKGFLNFNGGDAFFYIPKDNFLGEIQDYNFLNTKAIWDKQEATGKFTWEKASFTVINPNKTFAKHFPKLNQFVTQKCQESNIGIVNDLELVEIKKDQKIAVFKNGNGETVQKKFSYFYTLQPTSGHSQLTESGLADNEGFLDVKPDTLQHTKYANIFGVGDVINAPTTKTLYGGLSQVAVVRHNLERRLSGQEPNAKYDGYSKANLNLTTSAQALVEHGYDGKEITLNYDGFMSSLRSTIYHKTGAHAHQNLLKMKNFGPPYYKWMKTFNTSDSVPVKNDKTELQPEKKVA